MAITYLNPCEVTTDFTTVNSAIASTNNGYTGNSLRVPFAGGSYLATGAQKTLPTSSKIIQFRFKVASATTLDSSNSSVIFTCYSNGTYTNGSGEYAQFRLQGISGSSTTFKTALVCPANSYGGDYALATTLNKNQWYTITIEFSATAIKTYLDNAVTAFMTYTFSQSYTVGAINVGELYQNGASFINGNVDFDDIICRNANTIATDTDKTSDVVEGYIQKFFSNGAIVRPTGESNGSTNDTVSEAQAYGAQFTVQNNRQSYFDLIEQYSYARLDRRNYVSGGLNPPSDSYNLMAYHYSITNKSVDDWAAAYDADIDRAVALLWAHNRWGSAGTINYQSRALAIIGDLATYGLRQASYDSKWYLVSGTGNMSISSPEMNNSYLDPAAFKLFAQYDTTNAAKWNSAVSSSYDIINRTALAILPNPVSPGNTQSTTAKLPANWVTMNFTTGAVTPLSASYRDTNYTYDAFRQTFRLLKAYIWYVEATALTRMQDYKSFLISEWTTNSKIKAEYFHDGTAKDTYENAIFTYAAWEVITTNDSGNSTGAAIFSAKLANLYTQSPTGSYFGESSYYGGSWTIFPEMLRQGYMQNYGQSSTPAPNTGSFFSFF